MRRASLGILAIAGCFTGDSAQGLPCTADEFCAGRSCIDGFCGGAPDTVEPTDSSTSLTSEPTTGATESTGNTLPTSTTEPSSTSEVDTSGSETTGGPTTCDRSTCWGTRCFSLDAGDRFQSDGRPTRMAVARMDEDGLPDVVTANVEEGTFTLELRRGIAGGTFQQGETITRTLAANPDYLVVGALDNESHLDVVVAYQGNDELSILLWAGDNFEPVDGMPLPTGTQPRLPVVMDIDGEGELDVAYVVSEGLEAYAAIGIDGASPLSMPHGFYFNDLVGVEYDGAPALVAIHSSPPEVTLYRADPMQSELDELRFAALAMPELVAVVDFDLDGDSDAIVVATDGRIWRIPSFLDTDQGEVEEIGSFEGMGAPETFAVGQLDGECGLDLAVLLVNPGDSNHDVLLMRNLGDSLSAGELLGEPGTNVISIMDLDGADGGIDELVLASDAGHVQIARYSP